MQGTQKSQNNLEKEQSWRAHFLTSELTTKLLVIKKMGRRPEDRRKEQDEELGDKPLHLWSVDFLMRVTRQFKGEDGARTARRPRAEE